MLQPKIADVRKTDPTATPAVTPSRGGWLQRHAPESLPGGRSDSSVPPIARDILRSAGQPLDATTRSFMEPRFGHDFSHVRIHTGSKASESAEAVSAQAYTVGQQIVFGANKYAPESLAGRQLLAHELTHTVQQMSPAAQPAASSAPAAEQEAEQTGATITAGSRSPVTVQTAPGTLQKTDNNALDEKAKKIIEAGNDPSKSIDQRAIEAVNSIVKEYFDPALVGKVVYDEKDPGLTTSPVGAGKDIKGQITVGKYFIDNLATFARRVLQVGHELQHVQQQRAGMGGPAKKNEREFLAFHWEATQPAKAATGKMSHASRLSLTDEALRNYFCMPEADQKNHSDKKAELLTLRATEEKASGKEHTEPPKECPKK